MATRHNRPWPPEVDVALDDAFPPEEPPPADPTRPDRAPDGRPRPPTGYPRRVFPRDYNRFTIDDMRCPHMGPEEPDLPGIVVGLDLRGERAVRIPPEDVREPWIRSHVNLVEKYGACDVCVHVIAELEKRDKPTEHLFTDCNTMILVNLREERMSEPERKWREGVGALVRHGAGSGTGNPKDALGAMAWTYRHIRCHQQGWDESEGGAGTDGWPIPPRGWFPGQPDNNRAHVDCVPCEMRGLQFCQALSKDLHYATLAIRMNPTEAAYQSGLRLGRGLGRPPRFA